VLLATVSAQTLYAQEWKKKTNTSYLNQLSADLDKIYEDHRSAVETYAFERDILMRRGDGQRENGFSGQESCPRASRSFT
jgi:hypothetical protein